MGKNLVPWNLGPLRDMGKEKSSVFGEKSSVFGQAFALLSKRRCQSNHDFIHALLGLVKPISNRPLERDFDREYMRIARMCLDTGDYSPLLMTPRFEKHDDVAGGKLGFNDLGVWPLGAERQPPKFHQDSLFENGNYEEGDLVLKLEKLGEISDVYIRPRGCNLMAELAREASIVLKSTGPDLNSFVHTLGWRLYDQGVDFINRKLVARNELDKLAVILRKRYNQTTEDSWPIEGPEGARWLADAMSLSFPTPEVHGEPLSRMAWVNAHGDTLHVGYAGLSCLLSVLCVSCTRTFVFRAGLFGLPCNFRDYVAYRIPGLKYQRTLPNGVGIVIKDGRIVGRMVWATPACGCSEIEKVKIKMPVLPVPSPRPF
ncbi:MAG: hypothetical protein Q9172_003795 [Xanthocarpia lactea]